MNKQIPELSFVDIEKGGSNSINILSDALEDHGFFSITEHGLSNELVDKCYQLSKQFFNLEYETKNKYSSVGSKGARGYTPKGIETAVGENVPDQKEFWHHGPVVDDTFDQKIPKNIIIDEMPEFNKYYDVFFPRYKFFSKNFDLITYTYYNKKKLTKQIILNFKFKKNISIIKEKIYLKKVKKVKSKIDLIKVDVNGHEFSVIRGLNKIIKRDKRWQIDQY